MQIRTKLDLQNISSFLVPLAKKLRTNLQKACQETILQMPEHRGKGKISSFDFTSGVNLILFDFTPFTSISIQLESADDLLIQFLFCIEGSANHVSASSSKFQYQIQALQGVISSQPQEKPQILRFAAHKKVILAMLIVDREKYIQKAECVPEDLPKDLGRLFSNTDKAQSFFYQSNYSLAISECIQEIINNNYQHLIRTTFMEAKALELLNLQMKQYTEETLGSHQKIVISKKDVKCIKQARKILKEDLIGAPNIPDLAKKVGLNQQKLKKGFKKIFGSTIGRYLRKLRLERAKLLLLEGSLNIMEVAEQIGYKNSSYFSRRFKEKYGILPKDYRKHIRSLIPEKKKEERPQASSRLGLTDPRPQA